MDGQRIGYARVSSFDQNPNTGLPANHGPVVAGSSLNAAVDAIEELEETAKLYRLRRGAKTCFPTREQLKEIEA
ncbi:MAG TPA: class II aldolase/adducin family protein [Stellaceae bacterium]|nr:class II aldolase/adducin family protein [Stellaceae bacterium]